MVPSFFFTNRMGAPNGDLDGWMKPAASSSASCFLSSANSVALRRMVGRLGGVAPGISSMRWSTSRDGGRPVRQRVREHVPVRRKRGVRTDVSESDSACAAADSSAADTRWPRDSASMYACQAAASPDGGDATIDENDRASPTCAPGAVEWRLGTDGGATSRRLLPYEGGVGDTPRKRDQAALHGAAARLAAARQH